MDLYNQSHDPPCLFSQSWKTKWESALVNLTKTEKMFLFIIKLQGVVYKMIYKSIYTIKTTKENPRVCRTTRQLKLELRKDFDLKLTSICCCHKEIRDWSELCWAWILQWNKDSSWFAIGRDLCKETGTQSLPFFWGAWWISKVCLYDTLSSATESATKSCVWDTLTGRGVEKGQMSPHAP